MGINKNKNNSNSKSKSKSMSMMLDMDRVYERFKDGKVDSILAMGGPCDSYSHIFNGLKNDKKGFPVGINVFDGDDYPTLFILKSHLIQRMEEKLGIRAHKEELDQVEKDVLIAIDPNHLGGRCCMNICDKL
jgi:hypothetical protein